jgi:hypothetical protein
MLIIVGPERWWMTTASSVCRGVVLTSSRVKSASSAAICSGLIGLVEHWQVGAIAVFWEVSGTNCQYLCFRCWVLTSHYGWYWYFWCKVEGW